MATNMGLHHQHLHTAQLAWTLAHVTNFCLSFCQFLRWQSRNFINLGCAS